MIDAATDPFAVVYMVLIAVALTAAVAAGFVLERGGVGAVTPVAGTDPYEVAYLAGGPIRVTQAALAALAQRGAI